MIAGQQKKRRAGFPELGGFDRAVGKQGRKAA
jgi:hypothetical protein